MLRGLVVAAVLLVSCKNQPDLGERSDCDPLVPSVCALPFPSSFFLDEAETPTGYQVAFGPTSLPENRDDVQVRPDHLNEKDGFSTMASPLVWFDDVSDANFVSVNDIGASIAPGATTVILDAETGELVPHWVELDMTASDDAERVTLFRPVVPLEHARRYIIGIRGLQKNAGGEIDVSAAFEALRDDKKTDNPDVERRRAHFDEVVFPALEQAGFARGELQLAWDFVTVSRENSLGRAEWMRDDMLARLPAAGPAYTLTKIEDHDCETERIGRTIYGDMTVPLYTETDVPGTFLTRGDNGLPFYNGEATTEFMLRVPCSLMTDPKPSMLLQYGHGLLGDKSEGRTGWLSQMADEREWVVLAMDWKGMSTLDAPEISLMLVNDVSDFAFLPERSMQGFVEWVAAVRMIKGALATDPALVVDGVQLIDPERVGYYGNSQGGILGGAYMALSPDVQRGVLGVSGTPYNLLLTRSVDFDPFFLIFTAKYTDHRDIAINMGLMQMLWDPAESAGWLHAMNRDPGSVPAKDILLQVGIGDAQVTPLGAHVQARAYGAKLVKPAVRPVWGVEEVEPGFVGSALVEFDYDDIPEAPDANVPPNGDDDTHECPRREVAGQQQVYDFLTEGVVNQHCEGACVAASEGLCR